jgi:hypothetical protein
VYTHIHIYIYTGSSHASDVSEADRQEASAGERGGWGGGSGAREFERGPIELQDVPDVVKILKVLYIMTFIQ